MQIDHYVGWLHHLRGHSRKRPLRLTTGRVTRVLSVHALAVDRVQVDSHLGERGDVQQGGDDYRSRDGSGIELPDQTAERYDRGVFRPVTARYQGKHRPRARAVDDRDGKAGG